MVIRLGSKEWAWGGEGQKGQKMQHHLKTARLQVQPGGWESEKGRTWEPEKEEKEAWEKGRGRGIGVGMFLVAGVCVCVRACVCVCVRARARVHAFACTRMHTEVYKYMRSDIKTSLLFPFLIESVL